MRTQHIDRLIHHTHTTLFTKANTLVKPRPQKRGFTRWRCQSVCLFVSLSPVKFVNSFATWQQLTASGGSAYWYRLRYTCFMHTQCCHYTHSSLVKLNAVFTVVVPFSRAQWWTSTAGDFQSPFNHRVFSLQRTTSPVSYQYSTLVRQIHCAC